MNVRITLKSRPRAISATARAGSHQPAAGGASMLGGRPGDLPPGPPAGPGPSEPGPEGDRVPGRPTNPPRP